MFSAPSVGNGNSSDNVLFDIDRLGKSIDPYPVYTISENATTVVSVAYVLDRYLHPGLDVSH